MPPVRIKERGRAKKGTMKRLLSLLFSQNKKLLITACFCIIVSGITGVSSSIFLNNVLDTLKGGLGLINNGMEASDAWAKTLPTLIKIFTTMICVYGANLVASFTYTRLMAVLTQTFLHQIRTKMFNKMQSYPISFFDQNKTGDIMSLYTNDTDALRQLVSQSIPSLCMSLISIITYRYSKCHQLHRGSYHRGTGL